MTDPDRGDEGSPFPVAGSWLRVPLYLAAAAFGGLLTMGLHPGGPEWGNAGGATAGPSGPPTPSDAGESAPRADTLVLTGNMLSISGTGGGPGASTSCPSGIIQELRHVFRWHMNFPHDLHPGDAFRAVVRLSDAPDGEGPMAGELRVLGAEIETRGHPTRAVWHGDAGGGRGAYFEPDGTPMGASRIPTPEGFRMTSRFDRGRWHPVHGGERPHLGVDYAAPYGAVVRAVAPGTVSEVDRLSGLGLVVEVRHDAHRTTRYAHLSSVEEEVAVGRSVHEGEALGRAGSTGIATGPHLHFELLLDGRPRNPMAQGRRGPVSSGAPADPASFAAERDRVLELLETRTPAEPTLVRASLAPGEPASRPSTGAGRTVAWMAGTGWGNHPSADRGGVARWPLPPEDVAAGATELPGDAERDASSAEPVCALERTAEAGTRPAPYVLRSGPRRAAGGP